MANSQVITKVVFGLFTLITFMASSAQASAVTFSYHGRVFDEVKELPITGRANFKLKVVGNTSSCVLYAENHNNVKLSEYGVFSLEVGISQKMVSTDIFRDASDPGLSMAQVFSFVSSSSLGSGCMSDLTPQDSRKLVVEISAPNYSVQLDPQPILTAPTAALAFSLNGYTQNNFIHVNSIVTQAEIERIITEGREPGPIGPRGPAGAKGATGAKGAKGDTGAKGAKGDTGAKGAKGDTGAKGAKGDTGAKGAKGDTGAKGAKGDTGAKGAKGDTGAKGAKGDTGAKGAKGDTGAKGAKGDTGAKGAKGDTGAKGAKGDTGAKGAKGDTGAKGAKGDKGNAGVVKSFMCSSGSFLQGIDSSGNPVCKSVCDKNIIGEEAYNNCRTDITWVGRTFTTSTVPGACEDKGCDYRGPAQTVYHGETHEQVCKRVGLKVVTSHRYGICASGEARATQGSNHDKIHYKFGTWGGALGGGKDYSGTCYRDGQKQDGDMTDMSVAYLCGAK